MSATPTPPALGRVRIPLYSSCLHRDLLNLKRKSEVHAVPDELSGTARIKTPVLECAVCQKPDEIAMRPSGRAPDELRSIRITRRYTRHAEGSVLIEFGETRVLCTASVDERVPLFLKGKGQGWVTAEYGMLPRATHERTQREAARGKQGGRTMEIQRLIGRALRSAVDLTQLSERSITLDCDVLQADGGTRTASITGACVALADALTALQRKNLIAQNPLRGLVASVSVGLCDGVPVLDLDYAEDSSAETDMNVVMNDTLQFVEVQGTAERGSFTRQQMEAMTTLAQHGIEKLIEQQRRALATP